jgi:hypothetical protein
MHPQLTAERMLRKSGRGNLQHTTALHTRFYKNSINAKSERGVLVGCVQAACLLGLRQSRWALHLVMLQAAFLQWLNCY